MPSERRLHPSSIIFQIGKQFGALAVPLVVLFIGLGTDEDRWQAYAVVFIVPYAGFALTRYLSFRYSYGDSELVIRHGFIFRNQRHVPYDRIQNIDAVQNVLHRLIGVVEVRIQTGGGTEPEATLSVLTPADLDEMRQRVFGARAYAQRRSASAVAPIEGMEGELTAEAGVEPPSAEPPRRLLHLSPSEIALYGIVENRGLFVIAAAIGLLWEFAAMPQLIERYFGDGPGRWLVGRVEHMVEGGGGAAWRAVILILIFIALFLLISRVFSIVWALIRLHDFNVVRTGEDLRTEYGLLTRITQTIPRRRIQTVTVRQTPLHRWFKRASVRVSTAAGIAERRDESRREWFAPIVRQDEVPVLLAALVPGVDVTSIAWTGVHPRAIWRVFRRSLAWMTVFQLVAIFFAGWRALWLAPVLLAWATVSSRMYTRNLGWAISRDVVAFRTGTLVRVFTIAPLVRVQSVSLSESPFDRRSAMARVSVDTAGTGGGGYNVNIPYLPGATARDLHGQLSAAAATTAFQW